MAPWVSQATDHLWQSGLAAVPLVIVAALITKLIPCRPATRHLVWVMVLLWPLLPPLLPGMGNPWEDETQTGQDVTDVSLALSNESQEFTVDRAEHRAAADSATSSPSPRSGARAASAKPDLLAQRRGAVGLPPTVSSPGPHDSSAESPHSSPDPPQLSEPRHSWRADFGATSAAVSFGPFCPLWESSTPQVCYGDFSTGELATSATMPDQGDVESALGLESRFSQATDADARPVQNTYRLPEIAEDVHARPHSEPNVEPLGTARHEWRGSDSRAAGVVRADPLQTENDAPSGRFAFLQLAASQIWARAMLGAQQWSAVLLRVRDDIASLPMLPLEIWLSGTLFLLLIAVCRVAGFRRLIRRGQPASAEVCAMVKEAAEKIGLRRVPDVWMVRRCMSPMVWCAIRPRLLLPMQLWMDLDGVGRRAVIMHELAHLRRRDHWVLWADSLIGSLYWWHPVVWWVRRRVHLEAEYCCDAWVTALLPRTRRAYAQALLKTRQYLGEGSGWVPAMGMGISSGRAKRFARRLTMVMTTSSKPGASIRGVGLVLLMATFGWLAAPVRSCPDEEKKACGQHATPCDEAGKPTDDAKHCDEAKKIEKVEAEKARALEKTTFERHMAERALAGRAAPPTAGELVPAIELARQAAQLRLVAGNEEEQARIRELQAQLEALGRQLEELHEQMHGNAHAPRARGDGRSGQVRPRVHGHVTPVPPAPPAPPAHLAHPGHPTPPAPPAPPKVRAFATPAPTVGPRVWGAPMPEMPPMPRMPMFAPGEFPKPGQTWSDVTGEEGEWKTYKLSPGKRETFTEFMSRPDVPILVRPNPEGIDIRAGERAHSIFRAFFQLVDPCDERADAGLFFPGAFAVGLGHGLGEGLGEGLTVGAVGCGGGCDGCKNCKCEKCEKVRKERVKAKQLREEARAMANEIRGKVQGEAARARAEARARAREVRDRLRQDARRIRVEATNQEELIRSLEEQAETLREQADRMRERAERVRERAERVREREEKKGDDEDGADDGAFQQHMEMLERNAEGLDVQAEELAQKIAQVMEEVEIVRGGSDVLQQHAQEVEQRAEAVQELTDSIEGLEASPELADSIAGLAAQIEQLAVPAVEGAAEELFAAMQRMDLPGMVEDAGHYSAEALEAAIEAATAALEEAQEAAAERVEAEAENAEDDAAAEDDADAHDDDDSDDDDDDDSDDDENGDVGESDEDDGQIDR